MLQSLLFYLFSGVLGVSALMVTLARNPVHAVLFLILCFFNAAGLFLLLGAEFLAMLLVIVYVGAVMVLFLFVVMMLDIDFQELSRGVKRHTPFGIAVALIFLAELVVFAWTSKLQPKAAADILPQADNTREIGRVLYSTYFYPFEVSGLILLVAMIGAIVLTLRHRGDVKRQDISGQLARKREEAVTTVKVVSGAGVKL